MVTYLFYSIFKTHIGGEHARIKSKAEPTALTDYKKSLLFGEVCPASKKKKKKKKNPEFRAPILFLDDFFFSFFFLFFFYFFFHWRYGLHWKEETTRFPLH